MGGPGRCSGTSRAIRMTSPPTRTPPSTALPPQSPSNHMRTRLDATVLTLARTCWSRCCAGYSVDPEILVVHQSLLDTPLVLDHRDRDAFGGARSDRYLSN